jgi:hypothetical protein
MAHTRGDAFEYTLAPSENSVSSFRPANGQLEECGPRWGLGGAKQVLERGSRTGVGAWTPEGRSRQRLEHFMLALGDELPQRLVEGDLGPPPGVFP